MERHKPNFSAKDEPIVIDNFSFEGNIGRRRFSLAKVLLFVIPCAIVGAGLALAISVASGVPLNSPLMLKVVGIGLVAGAVGGALTAVQS